MEDKRSATGNNDEERSVTSSQQIHSFTGVTKGKSLDLDELFGFTEARKTLQNGRGDVPVEPNFIPHRIFLNNLDSFHSRHIAQFLSDQVVGELENEEMEAEEDLEEELISGEDESSLEEEKQRKSSKQNYIFDKNNYEIVGTVKDLEFKKTESIKEIIADPLDREAFLPKIMKCGFIIYDITIDKSQINEALWTLKALESELEKLQEEGPKAFKKMKDIRHFILISTVMTWASTKPVDPDDPDLPFTETQFRKRKPHPNYKDHIELEKEVAQTGKKFKDKLKTLVITSGIMYGGEEDVLHFLFKMAWYNEPVLPLFLSGNNHIPLINIKDFTSVLHNILENFPSKRRYILAVEMNISKLKHIVKAISSELSTGNYSKISKEEAFLIPELTQREYDMLTVNLRMEPFYIIENMNIKWVSELGFVGNIQQIVAEYKESRNLKPIKIFLHGPPAVGKTRIAKRLCKHYKLHYLNVGEVIETTLAELKEKIEKEQFKDKEEVEEMEEQEEEEEEEIKEEEIQDSLENTIELLEEVLANMKENNNRLDDKYVVRFFKEKMMSNRYQNQGFVLDGYPKETEFAQLLFGREDDEDEGEEEEEEDVEESEPSFNKKIMPEYVISLNAADEFLYDRVMHLPEKEIQGTHYSEEDMIRRVKQFRERNTDEETVLNYFDELEIHPLVIDVSHDKSPLMNKTFDAIINKIGKPRNYGDEAEGEEDITAEAILETELEEEKKKQEKMKIAHEENQRNMEEWANLLDAMKEEEEERLAIQGLPVRHYLMQYVFPTLTRGLLEVACMRPEDPVDYLAQYLFRENPEGRMFQPDYAEAAENLMNAIQQFQDSLMKSDSLSSFETSNPEHLKEQFRNLVSPFETEYEQQDFLFQQSQSSISSKEQAALHEQENQQNKADISSKENVTLPESKQESHSSISSKGHITLHEQIKEDVTLHEQSEEHVTLHKKSKEHVSLHEQSKENVTLHKQSKEHVTPHKQSKEHVTLHEQSKEHITLHKPSKEHVTLHEQEIHQSKSDN